MIQSVTLILLIYTIQDYSSLLITSFSMMFTMISILLSCFEYFLSSKFASFGSSIIMSFCVESNDIVTMNYKEFQSEFVFRKHKIIGCFAKLLKVKTEQVERLKPNKLSNGVMFVFAIAIDVSKYDDVKEIATQIVQDGTLIKVYISMTDFNLC